MIRFLQVVGILGLLMGAGALGYGSYAILDQHARLNRCQSVEATIIASRVESTPTQHVTEHKPVVRFKYHVDGTWFDCEQATPGDESGRHDWANRIVNRYPAGAHVTAYYDPQDPAYAFLVRRYDAIPYVAYLFGPLALGGGIMIIREAAKSRRGPPPPHEVGDGWYQLTPPTTLRKAKRFLLGLGLIWQILGAPAWLHYLSVCEAPTPLLFVVYLPIYLGAGCTLLALGTYAALVLLKLDDAVVLIHPARPRTGEALDVRVEQPVRQPVVVKSLDISLVCREAKRMWIHGAPQEHTTKIFTAKASTLADHAAGGDEMLVADVTLFVPDTCRPSTLPADRSKVRYLWDLNLKTRLRGWLPYTDKFSLTMEQGEADSSHADDMEAEIIDAEALP
jgi:hypothetical protein